MNDHTTTIPSHTVPLDTERELAPLPLLWAKALDEGDEAVLKELLTSDVVADLTPATSRIGLDFPVLTGRDTIIANMIGAVGPLDTTHMVSNVTYRGVGDGWLIEAYALAQHFPPGQGPDAAKTRHVLMGNTWTFHVRSTPHGPRVAQFTMDNRWLEGDPSALMAAVA